MVICVIIRNVNIIMIIIVKPNYTIYNYILIFFKKIASKLGFLNVYLNSNKNLST